MPLPGPLDDRPAQAGEQLAAQVVLAAAQVAGAEAVEAAGEQGVVDLG
jgi:hypothetical protein